MADKEANPTPHELGFEKAKALHLQEKALKDTNQRSNFYYTIQDLKNMKELRSNLKIVLSKFKNIPIINKETNIQGIITNNEINKISSKKAVDKSIKNGFSRDEHFKVAEDLKNLYENAIKMDSHNDYKKRDNIIKVHRFIKEIQINKKSAIAKITLFEKRQGSNKIYTLELENLETNPTP